MPAIVLLAVAGCATTGARVDERLDPQTAATVRATVTPFIYAHELPQFSANSRDYLSVGAVDVDRSGDHRYYLVAVLWSTIDRRRAGLAPPAPAERIEMSLAGKVRSIDAAGHDGRPLGVSAPIATPATGYLNESWYPVTPADLRNFATSPPATVTVVQDSAPIAFHAWERADAAFAALAEDLPATPASDRPSH
jgi:hypothetical protein